MIHAKQADRDDFQDGWTYELNELDSLREQDRIAAQLFLSGRSDTYRPRMAKKPSAT